MKTTLRGFIFVLLAVAGEMVLLVGNAQGADEALPPEVKVLIGMKIPAKAGDVVPGWNVMGAGMLGVKTETGLALGYELLYQQNISIFVIDAKDKDLNRAILDAHVLPRQLMNYNVNVGEIVFKKNASQFYEFVHSCKREPYEPLVVGLVRPEPGVAMGWSEQVRRAWAIDSQTGHITNISTQGVSCFVETGTD